MTPGNRFAAGAAVPWPPPGAPSAATPACTNGRFEAAPGMCVSRSRNATRGCARFAASTSYRLIVNGRARNRRPAIVRPAGRGGTLGHDGRPITLFPSLMEAASAGWRTTAFSAAPVTSRSHSHGARSDCRQANRSRRWNDPRSAIRSPGSGIRRTANREPRTAKVRRQP